LVERTHTDEQLLARCGTGDEVAFRDLYERHQRMVYNLVFRMTGNHADAEELVPDVFVRVWQKARDFRGGSRVSTWLYRIAANLAMDHLRSARHTREVFWEDLPPQDQLASDRSEAEDGPEYFALRQDDRRRLEGALMRLGVEERLLVTLYHLQDCSYAEIEDVTGISTTNIKSRLFRARRRLRQHMLGLEKGDASDDMQEYAAAADGLLLAAPVRG
jgi:RNA polymerase sigma factor (sigma-70 family)